MKTPSQLQRSLVTVGEEHDTMTIIGDSIVKHLSLAKVFTQSIRGGRVMDIANAITQNIIKVTNFSSILLHCGTNDINISTPEQILSHVGKLVEIIQRLNPNCKVFISAIISRPCDILQTQRNVVEVNKKLQVFCVGHNLNFIASYRKFCKAHMPIPKFFAKDGLHLSYQGVLQLSRSLARALHTNPK